MAPSIKNPPDYSLQDGVVGASFSRRECNELKQRYEFSDEYDLYSELNNALTWYRLGQEPHMQTGPRQDRAILTLLQRSAGEYLGLLESLSPGQQAILVDADERLDIPTLKRFVDTVRVLEEASRRGLKVIPPGRPVRKDDGRRATLEELHRVYRDGTGKDDRYTHDPVCDGYSGDFFSFTQTCFERLGIEIADLTLAGEISKTLR